MVIRSETRAPDGAVDGLVYRASDLAPFLATDLEILAAAVDRMEFGELLGPVVAGDVPDHPVDIG